MDQEAHACDVASELTFFPLAKLEADRGLEPGSVASDREFSYWGGFDQALGAVTTYAELEELPEPRCVNTDGESILAMHIVGGGYVSYEPNFGVEFGTTTDTAVDISEFDGISFWGRAGSASVNSNLAIFVQDVYTFPVQDVENRICMDPNEVTPPPGMHCYNGGHTERRLVENWRLFTLDFEEFGQETWGYQSPGGTPDLQRVLKIEFKLPLQDNFDVWIDNIAFYKRP